MQLVAIDLDGTLLSEDGTISERNRKALYDAQKQGIVIVICSGRSLHDTQEIMKRSEIDCPIITGNGANAMSSDVFIHNLVMPDDLVTELIPMLEEQEYYYELYTDQGVYLFQIKWCLSP